MKTTQEKLPKNSVQLTVELGLEEMRPYLERTAEQLSRQRAVPGFRPGKAPYAVMEKLVGADLLYQEAAELIIRETYPQVIVAQKLTTVGAPDITLHKLAPGNPLIYKATVALLPEITLGNYRTLKVKKRKMSATDDEIEKLLLELRQSRSTEKLVDRPATLGDKVEIDFNGFVDSVPLEGAASKTHPVLLGSHQFVPGFEEELVGLKSGDKKEFTVRFPKDYYRATLANRDVLFKVAVLSVFAVELPVADDGFAKNVGKFSDLAALKKQLSENIIGQKQRKERERYELAMLEKISEISTFGEFPDSLIDNEVEKMLHELHHDIENQGMDFAKYLESIKKTEGDLKKEFRAPAERRLKTALVTRAVAEQEHIEVSDAEVQKEIAETKTIYAGNAEVEQNLQTPEYARYLKNALTTKQVTEFLDGLMGVDDEAGTPS